MLQHCLIVALAYAMLGKLGLAVVQPGSHFAPLWSPAGLALAALLRWGPRCWPGIAFGALAVAFDSGASAGSAFGLALVDFLVPCLAAYGLTRAGFNTRLESRRDLWLLLLAVAMAAATAELIVDLFAAQAGSVGAAMQRQSLFFGWAGAALGLLVVAVPCLTLTQQAVRSAFSRVRWRSSLALLAATAACALLLFVLPADAAAALAAMAMLAGVLLAVLVLRCGLPIASTWVLCLSLAAALITTLGYGPLAAPAPMPAFGPLWLMPALPTVVGLLVHTLTIDLVNVERRWLMALGGAGLGIAEWRTGRDVGRVSEQWQQLMGDDSASLAQWLAHVHDDDRPGLRDAFERLQAGALGRSQSEIRVRAADGWRWLDAQLLVVERGHAGQASRFIATLSDSSERHDAQERQRLSASLFQHLHEGLLITDAQMRVLDVNPAFTQILGVPRQDMLGSVPSLLRPSPVDPLVRQQRQQMWDSLRATGRWRGEVVERRRNGEACTLQATISTVNSAEGAVQYHVLVISDISEQRQQRERLERQAHFDELTRLPNRTRLQAMLGEAMLATDGAGCLLAVCYLDLDHFKPVNDRFGHAAGDRLLVELAGRLRSALRSNEVWSDAAGRLGGDEFVLLLRAGTMEEARLAVQRVLRVVAQPYVIDATAEPVQVTASMGATVYPIDRSDADTLLRHADHAMYGAKQAGRNGYQFFDPEHRRRTEERVMAIGRVQEALDNREFVLFYQPKVDMRRGQVLGLEALLRWEHPQQGLIAPLQFLPLIDNTGLSSHIGDWVLGQALEHLAQWRRIEHDISVSVNISARHLQEPDFALRLAELLARHPESLAASLELEMLETAAHADIQATSALLARCRALGVRIALDDFGTGYSTLSYLKQLPVDVLKIDRSFVHHMLDDAQDRAIVEGVIGLARTFQCVVVAEGVESPAQARTLLDMGCNIGQGTGIAAPMPASAVSAWIRDYRGLFALSAAAGTAAVPQRVSDAAND
jgi:diguanylate cyclase (GGDEF)-like protein/PAS domain S-box-containing protein